MRGAGLLALLLLVALATKQGTASLHNDRRPRRLPVPHRAGDLAADGDVAPGPPFDAPPFNPHRDSQSARAAAMGAPPNYQGLPGGIHPAAGPRPPAVGPNPGVPPHDPARLAAQVGLHEGMPALDQSYNPPAVAPDVPPYHPARLAANEVPPEHERGGRAAGDGYAIDHPNLQADALRPVPPNYHSIAPVADGMPGGDGAGQFPVAEENPAGHELHQAADHVPEDDLSVSCPVSPWSKPICSCRKTMVARRTLLVYSRATVCPRMVERLGNVCSQPDAKCLPFALKAAFLTFDLLAHSSSAVGKDAMDEACRTFRAAGWFSFAYICPCSFLRCDCIVFGNTGGIGNSNVVVDMALQARRIYRQLRDQATFTATIRKHITRIDAKQLKNTASYVAAVLDYDEEIRSTGLRG